jgi:putative ATPase
VLGPQSALRSLIEADELRSVILWGPAGTGKTSLAHIIAQATRSHFEELSATSAGVKDVRALLAAARERLGALGRRSILFIDEIHRFNKGQQDALLPGVEDRTVVLVGATTENPFFTVNAPLMSRSLLFRLEPLGAGDLELIITRALADPERGLGGRGLALDDDALAHLVDRADGDARHALNALEAAALVVTAKAGGARGTPGGSTGEPGARITLADIEDALQRPRVTYDRAGDQHYDVASAFIKSIRGSDPDAALHYLARMLAAGEDPRFVARRLVISASEDVGLADPQALPVAVAAFQALEFVGLPEARLNLAEAVVYLALAPKSNSAYAALGRPPGAGGGAAGPGPQPPPVRPRTRASGSSASGSATSTPTTTPATGWPSATCPRASAAATTGRPTRARRRSWPRPGGAAAASPPDHRLRRRPRRPTPTAGAADEPRPRPRPAGRRWPGACGRPWRPCT